MPEAIMAHPDLRHPNPRRPINPHGGVTVLYDGKSIHLQDILTSEDPTDQALWIPAADLPEVNGFEVKPEGACLGELCIPLKADGAIVKQVDGEQWVNLVAFADWLEQPYVANTTIKVWSFGEIPAKRQSMMADAMAPDFEVLDRQGNVVRMSDFKGKKALVITWSSW